MKQKTLFGVPLRAVLMLAFVACTMTAQAAGIDMPGLFMHNPESVAAMAAMAFVGEVDGASILKALESVETKMNTMSEKATAEMKDLGKVSADTKTAIDNLGIEQRTLADRLVQLEQKSTAPGNDTPADESVGALFTKDAGYAEFQKKTSRGSMGLEVKNTVTNAIANTFSERRPGIVEGAFRVFTIEDLLVSIPTSSNAIDWVRENVFTNNAAEVAEGLQMPQSSITFAPGTMPVQSVAHFVKISRQLAMDNAALAAYINRRMVYGVNLRVENQLVAGNGTAPNLSGLTLASNFTAHGYTAASMTALNLSPTNRFDLIGKMIGDCAAADYPADVVIVNTIDWWTMRLAKDAQGRYILGDPGSSVPPTLFGLPVVASNAMTIDTVWVGSLAQAATKHERESITLDLSDSDENNFQLQLVTIRAMRRLALTVEKPAAARFGDLTPA